MNDASYEAGYRAGHRQGWMDALAKVEQDARRNPTPGAGFPEHASAPDQPRLPFQQPIGRPAGPSEVLPPAPSQQPSAVKPRLGTPVVARIERPQISPAGLQARKEKRDRQNINIILYVASLLLVAAAALFIGTGLPPALRFAGVCAVTATFYAAGLVLHARAPRLRPAAVAFAGTGLALVPIVGLAMYNFALPNGPLAWLLTSLLGVVAYVAAAVRMNSRVLVYLSLTFVVSTAVSGVSVLEGALVWHFAAVIGVSVVLTVVSLARPDWVPSLYLVPLRDVHPYLVPAVAVAATVAPALGLVHHALVMALATAYFVVVALADFRLRTSYFYAGRITVTLGTVSLGWHLGGVIGDGFLLGALVLAGQSAFVAVRQESLQQWLSGGHRPAGPSARRAATTATLHQDVVVTFALQLLLTLAAGTSSGITGWILNDGRTTAVPLVVPVVVAMITAMLVAALMGGRTEGMPPAVLAVVLLLAPGLDRWLVAGLFLCLAAYWVARAGFAAGRTRNRLVLAARCAGTAAVPFVVHAVEGPHREQLSHALIALVLALACQQVATAVLVRWRIPASAPSASLAWFTLAGIVAFAVLAAMDRSNGQTLTVISGLALLAATLVSAFLVLDRLRPGMHTVVTTTGSWQPAELLPFFAAVVIGPLLFVEAGRSAGNTALALLLAYFLACGKQVQLRERQAVYWLLARAAGSGLALSLFLQWNEVAGPWIVGGDTVGAGTVLVVVLALQLAFPLAAELRRRGPSWVAADAGAALAVQLGAAAWVVSASPGQAQLLAVVAAVSLSAAAAGYVLRDRPGAVWFAPVVLSALLVALQEELAAVELLLAVFAAYSAVMVVAAEGRKAKGGYFVAARVLTAALAVLLSYDAAASATVVTLTFAAVLAAQHLIRWLMRHRLADIPYQQAAVWITLAGQAALPLGYLLQPFGSDDLAADGGRWVLFVVLGLLMVSAVVARTLFTLRGASYFVTYAVLSGVLFLGPVEVDGRQGNLLGPELLDSRGVACLLMFLALAATAAGIARRHRNPAGPDHWLWAVSATAFSLVAASVLWAAADPGNDWLAGSALLVLAAVLFAAGRVESLRWAFPPAAALVLPGAYVLAAGAAPSGAAALPGPWDSYFPWLCGVMPAAAVVLLTRWLMQAWLANQGVARWSLAVTAGAGFAGAALSGLQQDSTAWAGTVFTLVTAAVAASETPRGQRRPVIELGALAVTAALQRAALLPLTGPGRWPDVFWLCQWYVVLAAVLGALRFLRGQATAGRLILGAGAVILTLSGLLVILGGTGAQQLWMLVAMALLMVGGILLGERIFVWWGAAGVALCVLWAMRDYTFALLALIAVGLISFAVWRLNRSKPGT